MRRNAAFIILLLLVFATMHTSAAAKSHTVVNELKIKQKLVQLLSGDFDKEKLRTVFDDLRLKLDYSLFPAKGGKPLNYFSPQFGLLTKDSLEHGARYFTENKEDFDCVRQEYGVPPEVILGIFRIETNFGRSTGKRPVITTLYTLYVLSPRPKKRKFALVELRSFLKLSEKNNWDPFDTSGSWSGAIGIPQFIPSSWFLYAIDGNGDGKINLFENSDAIWSTGNYLKRCGWGRNRTNQRRAVYSYNHERMYVKAVLAYAEAVKKHLETNKSPQ